MPSGPKKRKALKKKKKEMHEAIGVSTNNKDFNSHGNDEQGSQNGRGSDCNLSSPGFKDSDITWGQEAKVEDVTAVGRGTDHEENGVDKPPNSLSENLTHNTRKLASQEAAGTWILEIAPVNDSLKPVGSSVSMVVISDKYEQVESLKDSDSVKQKSDEIEYKRILKEAKESNFPGSAAETSKENKSVKESEVPECSEEKSLLPLGPSVARTSWLSCCGLLDVMAGSER